MIARLKRGRRASVRDDRADQVGSFLPGFGATIGRYREGDQCSQEAGIHDHIDHCLQHAHHGDAKAGENPLEEFKQITKYL